ncbi:MAG: diphthamide biosynthesis enzyme Dph2 [Candidatus Pacearchaeota archaeon]
MKMKERFDLEEKKLIEILNRFKPKKVLIQIPEGLKKDIFEIIKPLEKRGIEVIISGESCWGACSLALDEAKKFKVDLLIHYGHTKFFKTNFPVAYIEIVDKKNLDKLIERSLEKLEKYKRIGLSFSIQHKEQIRNVTNLLKRAGKEVFLSKKRGLVEYEGQIVGCQYLGLKEIKNNVDCFLVIGNRFHGLGAALAIPKKKVFLVDSYNEVIEDMDELKEKTINQRFFSIEKFKSAKKIGIIIETKFGQNFGNSKIIKEKIERKKKKALIITMSEITPEKIMNFYNIDSFVELACPRIATDDYYKYQKPLLTYKEALVGLDEKKWEDLFEEGFI